MQQTTFILIAASFLWCFIAFLEMTQLGKEIKRKMMEEPR